jgi:hypothetical protein
MDVGGGWCVGVCVEVGECDAGGAVGVGAGLRVGDVVGLADCPPDSGTAG